MDEESFISFIHKSLQEFLAGKFLTNLFAQKPDDFHNTLKQIDSWKLVLQKFEVLKFFCGISWNQQKSAATVIIDHVIKKYNEICKSKNMSANNSALCRYDNEHHVHVESYVDIGDVHSGGSKHANATDCLPILTLLHEAQLKGDAILPSLFSGSVLSKPLSVVIDCKVLQALMLFHYFMLSVGHSSCKYQIHCVQRCKLTGTDIRHTESCATFRVFGNSRQRYY